MNEIAKINCAHHVYTKGATVQASKNLPHNLTEDEVGGYLRQLNRLESPVPASITGVVNALAKLATENRLDDNFRYFLRLHFPGRTTTEGAIKHSFVHDNDGVNGVNAKYNNKLRLSTDTLFRFGGKELADLNLQDYGDNYVYLNCENKDKIKIITAIHKRILSKKETDLFKRIPNSKFNSIKFPDIDINELRNGVSYDRKTSTILTKEHFSVPTEAEIEAARQQQIETLLGFANQQNNRSRGDNVNSLKNILHRESYVFLAKSREIENKIKEIRGSSLTLKDLTASIKLIESINEIKEVEIDRCKLIIHTNPITIDYTNPAQLLEEIKRKNLESKLNLGGFKIIIDAQRQKIYSAGGVYHPHIGSGGTKICFGTIKHDIYCALKDGDYLLVVQNLIQALKSYNRYDIYSRQLISLNWCDNCKRFRADCVCAYIKNGLTREVAITKLEGERKQQAPVVIENDQQGETATEHAPF